MCVSVVFGEGQWHNHLELAATEQPYSHQCPFCHGESGFLKLVTFGLKGTL